MDTAFGLTRSVRDFVSGRAGRLVALTITRREPLPDGEVITVAQLHEGVPVRGGGGTVVVRKQAIIYADVRVVDVPATFRWPSTQMAASSAVTVVLESDGKMKQPASVEPPVFELIVSPDGAYAAAWRVEVQTTQPPERWWVWVDAASGRILDRRLRSAHEVEGTVQMSVDVDCQDQGTELRPMPHIEWAPGRVTDAEGAFRTDEAIAEAQVSIASAYFRLNNRAGAVAGPWRFPLEPSPASNRLEVSDVPLDQSTPLYHAHVVRDWLRSRLETSNSQKAWTEEQVTLNINVPQTCNATYNGDLNFFRAGNGCINTGRASTIVYHEYGHGIHDHSGTRFDSQVSEGIADFTAATIRNSPSISGIRGCNQEFRSCVNTLTYCGQGCDMGPGSQVHAAGQVICAVWWKLRGLLVERYGYDEGVAVTDSLFLDFLTAVTNMSSTYQATIAVDADDDGDPSNGTRHSCEINRAFASDRPGEVAHFPELVERIPSAPTVALSHTPPGSLDPDVDALKLRFSATVEPGCAPSTEAPTLKAVFIDDVGQQIEVAVPYREDGEYAVDVSWVPAGTSVDYYIEVSLAGADFYAPNQLRPDVLRRYQGFPPYRQTLYVGSPEIIAAYDFEQNSDAFEVSACDRGRAGTCAPGVRSDWIRHEGSASTSGGPSEAHSGVGMWATNPDGPYTRSRRSRLALPAFDATDFSEVRLQYWRFLINADVGAVEVNGRRVYENRAGAFFWRDPSWTFQDLDISPWAAGRADVRVAFVIDDEFDDSFELGGWHVDDVRLVGTRGGGEDPGPTGQPGEPAEPSRTLSSGCTASGTEDAVWPLLLIALAVIRRRRKEAGR